MKRLATIVSLTLALGSGCAHQPMTKQHAVETAATIAVIAGLVLLASQVQCENCNVDLSGPHAAIPPR